ncbi:MAG: RNA 2',3'-cyclic phosphodiesterase, partial [Acidilobaceae archaeon]
MSILRVFIAVDIEDPLIISRLDRVKDALVSTGVPMKVVESYNMHLTLRFIGEVSRGVVDSISRALSRLEFKEFTIVLRGLGAFPNSL